MISYKHDYKGQLKISSEEKLEKKKRITWQSRELFLNVADITQFHTVILCRNTGPVLPYLWLSYSKKNPDIIRNI